MKNTPKIGVVFLSVYIVEAKDEREAIEKAHKLRDEDMVGISQEVNCSTLVIPSETIEAESLTESEVLSRLKALP